MNMLYDAVEVEKPHMTRDGYLVAEAHVARTGIQTYLADELRDENGALLIGDDPTKQIRVYRPPEEVFATDAMHSYAYRPVTVDHPSQMVDANNWKEHSRGQTGGEVLRDGEFVRVPMVLMDSSAIDEWKAGKRELSMGYTMTLDMTDGKTPEGEAYDAVQRDLKMNHLALVARARGGSKLKLGDDTKEVPTMSDTKLKTITVDGLSVETTDAGAQAVEKLQSELKDARTKLDDTETKHTEAIKAKDKELATKDAEIDDLKGKVLDADALDKQVQERADLISKAKQIADKDYTGLAAEDIRKNAVTAKLGADAVKDKSAEYIEARFDILAEDADADPVRKVVRSGSHNVGDTEKAYGEMCDHLTNAWQPKEAH